MESQFHHHSCFDCSMIYSLELCVLVFVGFFLCFVGIWGGVFLFVCFSQSSQYLCLLCSGGFTGLNCEVRVLV